MASPRPPMEQLLACPACGASPVEVAEDTVVCRQCGGRQEVRGTVVASPGAPLAASFDDLHEGLEEHNHHSVVWDLCYTRQCDVLTAAMAPGDVVLDLGCGPGAPYTKPDGVFTIGVDPSLPSLEANQDIDIGLHASGARIPLADDTVDVVLAVYALHHMIGSSVAESWRNVQAAFAEMARVAKPGARVFVMEICPPPAVYAIERAVWRAAKRALGSQIDFVFWPADRLVAGGASVFPGAVQRTERFSVAPFAMFPPVIGRPKLRVPRILYPFHVSLLRWDLPRTDPRR